MTTIPDLHWYSTVSEQRHVPIRCPHASTGSCPRYYQSLSLLGGAGFTRIPEKEDKRLLKFWKKSDLWPKTYEQATSTTLLNNKMATLSSFCPEVAFDGFGYFATFLGKHADEIDSEFAHQSLRKRRAPPEDPHWQWADVIPQHYTECPLYSVITHRANEPKDEPWWRKHLAELVTAVIVAFVTVLITHFLT